MRKWSVSRVFSDAESGVVSDGVFRHGRALAVEGNAQPIACLLYEEDRVVAGAVGRTEFDRLFVNSLWVTEAYRRQGIGSAALQKLELAAHAAGCRDAIIETLDDRAAKLYKNHGYEELAYVAAYVGPFNRHILLKRFSSSGA